MGPTETQNQLQTPIASIPTPAVHQEQANAGLNVLNNLIQYRDSLNQPIAEATKKALIPTSVTGPGTSPGLMLNPVQPFQAAPFIQKHTTGHAATRDKGIANTVIAAANTVGKYENKHQMEKQRSLAVDLERVLQSQQGINEAKQALQANPNNQAAKDALAKNSSIIDAILSDPKRRRDIGKALDINFTDPSKNTGMEHGAFQQAVNSYSSQLEKATPSSMQINPEAVTKLQLLQGQQKSTDELIKTLAAPMIKAQADITTQGMKDKTTKQITAATILGDFVTNAAKAKSAFDAAVKVATINGNAKLAVANKQVYAHLAGINALIAGRLKYLQTKNNLDIKGRQTILTGVITAEQNAAKFASAQMAQNEIMYKDKGMMSEAEYNSLQSALRDSITNYNALIKTQTAHLSDIGNLTGNTSDKGTPNVNQSSSIHIGKSTNIPLVGPKQDDEFDTNALNEALTTLGTGSDDDNTEQ